MKQYGKNSTLMLIACLSFTGCGATQTPQAPVVARTQSKTYPLKGVVRSVAKETHRLYIRHEAIPGFMAAMSMPFTIKDQQIFTVVRPGDTVEGTLHVELREGAVEDYELRELKITQHAPTPVVAPADSVNSPADLTPRRLQPGDVVPNFAMTGDDGKTHELSDFKGKVVVLTFIYTRCPLPDFCPRMDTKFSELARQIAPFPERARSIRLISLSFDPEHDTPEVLKKHGQIRGVIAPLWTYAVASHEELAKVAAPLGLTYGPARGEVMHNLCTAIIGPDGKLARIEVGSTSNKWETSDFLKSIYSLIPKPQK
jgi:protein SCO1/2